MTSYLVEHSIECLDISARVLDLNLLKLLSAILVLNLLANSIQFEFYHFLKHGINAKQTKNDANFLQYLSDSMQRCIKSFIRFNGDTVTYWQVYLGIKQ